MPARKTASTRRRSRGGSTRSPRRSAVAILADGILTTLGEDDVTTGAAVRSLRDAAVVVGVPPCDEDDENALTVLDVDDDSHETTKDFLDNAREVLYLDVSPELEVEGLGDGYEVSESVVDAAIAKLQAIKDAAGDYFAVEVTEGGEVVIEARELEEAKELAQQVVTGLDGEPLKYLEFEASDYSGTLSSKGELTLGCQQYPLVYWERNIGRIVRAQLGYENPSVVAQFRTVLPLLKARLAEIGGVAPAARSARKSTAKRPARKAAKRGAKRTAKRARR